MTTFSDTLERRSKASPLTGSPPLAGSLPITCRPSVSSSKITRRLAFSATGKLDKPAASLSLGRVRVRSQAKHCPPSRAANQVQPERLRLRHTCHTRPAESTYRPVASTGTIARSPRENPRLDLHETHSEFSKWSGLSQTRQRNDFTGWSLRTGA